VTTGQKRTAGHLCTLFHLGAVGDVSDRQLLEQFASGHGEPADLAFTALVHRHAPMVLRVCTALLHDPHDAQDAVQATFLVLLRKSRDLWVHDSLGPWLHRVATRTAQRAQTIARRRRECERTEAASRMQASLADRPGHDTPSSILHEEIDRLPNPLRVLVVLCHLEGQSQELASRTLSLPVGTVKSRLHRARSLLRTRLARRGVGCSLVVLSPEPPARPGEAVHPFPLCLSILRAAAQAGSSLPAGDTSVSARAVLLFEEVIKTMFVTRMRVAATLVLLAGCIAVGASGVFAQDRPQNAGQPGKERTPAGTPAATQTAKKADSHRNAPSFVRRSRKMIVERLEHELNRAEGQLGEVTARPRSPENDAIALHLRKTVTKLADLLDRIDAVLADAVDEFPTMFDFASEKWDQELKTQIEAVTAAGADRVEWARRMFENGYISKTQYNAEILKQYYDSLKARAPAQPVPPRADLAPPAKEFPRDDRAKLPPSADTASAPESAPDNESPLPF
jgi:RNA polymerase sigma factor (sigma-70 family)